MKRIEKLARSAWAETGHNPNVALTTPWDALNMYEAGFRAARAMAAAQMDDMAKTCRLHEHKPTVEDFDHGASVFRMLGEDEVPDGA